MRVPSFSATTKGQWDLHFNDILADALKQGPLRRGRPKLPLELLEWLQTHAPQERSLRGCHNTSGLLPCQQAGGPQTR